MDKLTQREWHDFVVEMREIVHRYLGDVYFFGGSATYEPWQNVCWVAEIRGDLEDFYGEVAQAREKYKQDSIVVTIGNTEFI